MKTLIIIGVQKDLCDPSGKVYIKGGEKIIDPIVKLIQENTTIEQIIFVVDWRLPEDASFNSIPEQCIQFTEGAAIPEKLIKACKERGFLTLDGKLGDDEGDVTLVYYLGQFTKIKVPTMIEGHPVKYIAVTCYNYNNNIISVNIPDGIVSIG